MKVKGYVHYFSLQLLTREAILSLSLSLPLPPLSLSLSLSLSLCVRARVYVFQFVKPKRNYSYPYRVEPFLEGETNYPKVASPGSVCILLKTELKQHKISFGIDKLIVTVQPMRSSKYQPFRTYELSNRPSHPNFHLNIILVIGEKCCS